MFIYAATLAGPLIPLCGSTVTSSIFLLPEGLPFNISWCSGLLVMNCFNFVMVCIVFILKDIFAG